MITTIQIRDNVKNQLDRLKENHNESYEQTIIRLMQLVEEHKRRQKELLVESCKEMAEESLKITKEWESTDAKLDWEWNDNK